MKIKTLQPNLLVHQQKFNKLKKIKFVAAELIIWVETLQIIISIGWKNNYQSEIIKVCLICTIYD